MWNKFVGHPEILLTVKAAEDKFGTSSPFSTVSQMVALTRMCNKKNAKLSWLFAAIMDAALTGRLHRTDVSRRSILDKNRVSAVDLILYKYELHAELMGPVLSRLNFTAHVQSQLRVAYQSHDVLRKNFGMPGMHILISIQFKCGGGQWLCAVCCGIHLTQRPATQRRDGSLAKR